MEEKYTLAQWLNNDLTETELKNFEASEDFVIFNKIKKYSAQLQTPFFNENKMLETIFATPKQQPKVIPLFQKTFFKVAAILLVFISIGYFYTSNLPEIIVAENNEKKEFLLPDNSEIVLNTGSKIEYKKNNWDTNRNLNLSGEAYFKVAKGKKFTVQSNQGNVQVLGTQFNVNTNNELLKVVCYEGKVQVVQNNTKIILNPTESVTFKNGKIIENIKINHLSPSWLNNQLTYSNTSLEKLIVDLNNQYKIKIKNVNLQNNQLFTGNIPANNLDVAIKIIASTYQIQFTKVNNNNYILEKL